MGDVRIGADNSSRGWSHHINDIDYLDVTVHYIIIMGFKCKESKSKKYTKIVQVLMSNFVKIVPTKLSETVY